MIETPMDRTRRRVGWGMILVIAAGLAWMFSPGLPVLWGPYASPAQRQAGEALFAHTWQADDPLAHGAGVGPVFNASSCAECHFQSGLGGGGTNSHNVMTFEVHPTKADPDVHTGAVHRFALDPACQETPDVIHQLFPVVKGGQRIISGCSQTVRDFDPVHLQPVNSPALFGDGWIDRISDKAILNSLMKKQLAATGHELAGNFHADFPAGRPRYLSGGRVGRFGWKGQFASLQDFVAAACANELGLGNPLMDRAKPVGHADSTPAAAALDRAQFRAIYAFVDTLPRPVEVTPADAQLRDRAAHGKRVFTSVGRAACHTPDLGGVNGIYSDLLLHHIEDPQARDDYGVVDSDEPLPTDQPDPDEWKTPPLWGVADSAPYFHDGGSGTLIDAIRRHHGDASNVTRAFNALGTTDQEAVVAFLQTLKAPPDAPPVKAPANTQMAER